jgi:hypothetical protein
MQRSENAICWREFGAARGSPRRGHQISEPKRGPGAHRARSGSCPAPVHPDDPRHRTVPRRSENSPAPAGRKTASSTTRRSHQRRAEPPPRRPATAAMVSFGKYPGRPHRTIPRVGPRWPASPSLTPQIPRAEGSPPVQHRHLASGSHRTAGRPRRERRRVAVDGVAPPGRKRGEDGALASTRTGLQLPPRAAQRNRSPVSARRTRPPSRASSV